MDTEGPPGIWVPLLELQTAGNSNKFHEDEALTEKHSKETGVKLTYSDEVEVALSHLCGAGVDFFLEAAATLWQARGWLIPRGGTECRCHKHSC